jgi:hypothetical protein
MEPVAFRFIPGTEPSPQWAQSRLPVVLSVKVLVEVEVVTDIEAAACAPFIKNTAIAIAAAILLANVVATL